MKNKEYSRSTDIRNAAELYDNLSTSDKALIEAMMVGAPCVTSYVGGISDYLIDGENGYFYRSDEPEMLAYRVIELFSSIDKCSAISKAAKASTINARCSLDLSNDFRKIYSEIVRNKTI